MGGGSLEPPSGGSLGFAKKLAERISKSQNALEHPEEDPNLSKEEEATLGNLLKSESQKLDDTNESESDSDSDLDSDLDTDSESELSLPESFVPGLTKSKEKAFIRTVEKLDENIAKAYEGWNLSGLVEKDSDGGISKDPYHELHSMLERNIDAPLDELIARMEIAVAGANDELAMNPDNEEYLKKQQEFVKVLNFMQKLRALANNRMHYDEASFKNQGFSGLIGSTLEKLVAKQRDKTEWVYENGRPRRKAASTEFSTTENIVSNKGSKFNAKIPLKIDHTISEDGSAVVRGSFKFDREACLKNGDDRTPFEKMNAQVKDFVTISLHEFGKGSSPDNPIYIQYPSCKQPELALAAIMEIKKRAMLEQGGKVYYATYEYEAGKFKDVQITGKPLRECNQDERDYFLHFARQNPEYKSSKGEILHADESAGLILFKNKIPEDKKTRDKGFVKVADNIMVDAMDKHLQNASINFVRDMSAKANKIDDKNIEVRHLGRPG